MIKQLPRIYLITDRQQIPKDKDFFSSIEELLKAGVKMLQLREKDLSPAELYPIARQLRSLTNDYNCLLLINDRIDLALAINADGVHLGHQSLPIEIARKILGKQRIIGASTHSEEDVKKAQKQGADFITYGPVYFTPSKAIYGKPVGIKSLQQICQTYKLPVYALGGIKQDNVFDTMQSGVYGISVISALLSALSPNETYQQLMCELQKGI